ncbi:transcriptional regulator PpsR [Paracraurococcus lichenis]|uniref:Transcriptional regulator PpsR n=1 Tax=Paracraurococcus lichenis TaxID=3064888 RepID=A0ABT9DU79_9PROT|nr:transcriptional regulator PpsR [Paracraurococcus sp. LOR1-02]MDO9707451.1 transcriptional regulator PpsR [Paracraurococcus sp. LOR1-02]
MKAFKAPKTSLGDLDAEAAASLIAAAADVAIIVDAAGAVRDVAFNSESLAQELAGQEAWLGRPWPETVAPDSRAKVESLLQEAGGTGARPWRHVNLLAARGSSVPILFSAVRLGDGGRAIAFGRDLRQLSALQQRLLEAQQSLDRDYSRLRNAETRYRMLFQLWSDPVLILDTAAQKVTETNQAADRLLGRTPRRPQGREFLDLFDAKGREAVELLLAGVRATGRADEVRAQMEEDGKDVLVSASPFRQENTTYLLIRLGIPTGDASAILLPKAKSKLLKLVESVPDAFVVTGQDGRIMTANAAFLDMTQLANEDQAVGEPLERWLGQPGVELEVLTASLRQRGPVRLFATTLRGEFGATTEVEISAVSVMNGVGPCFGFAIRDVGPRVAPPSRAASRAPRSVEQLTELIGQVPLKDLVREATDVIERLCIEAALELTGDNRASAAEMLGLSRQSLYVKLRRYGLGDLPADGSDQG